mmetsp:Transcript_24385/g.61443  ORF Transcript_24385/g.61443 Transcript_24385/m.61443 type:complete len:227 (-) Transcript_24385:750-1430(-)
MYLEGYPCRRETAGVRQRRGASRQWWRSSQRCTRWASGRCTRASPRRAAPPPWLPRGMLVGGGGSLPPHTVGSSTTRRRSRHDRAAAVRARRARRQARSRPSSPAHRSRRIEPPPGSWALHLRQAADARGCRSRRGWTGYHTPLCAMPSRQPRPWPTCKMTAPGARCAHCLLDASRAPTGFLSRMDRPRVQRQSQLRACPAAKCQLTCRHFAARMPSAAVHVSGCR